MSSAPGTPITAVQTSAAGPTSHHTGPNSANAPVPSGPPDAAASSAAPAPHPVAASPAATAVPPGVHACARAPGSGTAARAMNRARNRPAASGTPTAAQLAAVPGPWSGTAASSGKSGSAGRPPKVRGLAVDAVPRAKPGPRP